MAKFSIGSSLPKGKIVEAFSSTLTAASSLSGSDSGAQSPGSSRVAEGAEIQGELQFSGSLYFAGKLEGSILAKEGNLELRKNGEVHGDIDCQLLDCYGQVFGNIQVHGKSLLRNDCKVIGDIVTKELSIQNGAQINGHCRMLGEKIDMDFFSMPIDNLRKQLKSQK